MDKDRQKDKNGRDEYIQLRTFISIFKELKNLLLSNVEVEDKNLMHSNSLDFIKNNVFGVTELKRGTRFNEILDEYERGNTDFYIVQSAQQKSKAVIVNLDHFQELLKAKELIEKIYDDLCDEHIYQIALERSNEVADIPLNEALKDEDELDFEEIMAMAERFNAED